MFYSWEETYRALRVSRHKYDCVIRSRYDLGANVPIDINKLDMSKINISNQHWPNSEITDDNLCILNQENAQILFDDIFWENTSWRFIFYFSFHCMQIFLITRLIKTFI